MRARDYLMSRRSFLIGCSAAASPLLTPISFAAAPGENRLVVIVLRGALDGLDLVRPIGDPAYAALRPTLARGAVGAALDPAGFFALHPACARLMPMWQVGDLGFVHAVATPYRAHRSHFTGQDILENGGPSADGELSGADGWLNRALARIPGSGEDRAVTVGAEPMLILEGSAPARHWLPVAESRLSSQAQALLARLHGADQAFADSFAEAMVLRAETRDGARGKGTLGTYVSERLAGAARIAAFSLGGWDTHQNQAHNIGVRLGDLTDTLLALQAGLGRNWGTTLVLAMTEFGRTARENGTGGTDHGTGGVMILAGGAVRGGQVRGRWPGLGDADLYRQRDLMPTGDVRAWAAWALHDLFGLARSEIEGGVFPGLDMGDTPHLIR